MNAAQQIQQIEINMDQARAIIEKGAALERLRDNPDFIKLIEEEYFVNEAARLASLFAAPGMDSPGAQGLLVRQISSIGELQAFFNKIFRMADGAIRTIEGGNEELAELRMEAE